MAKIARGKAAGKTIEIWFGDEARVGQKNKITRRWALRGTRPIAPHDQRTQSTYIFGAICPAEGKAAGLVLPFCNTAAMDLHLAEISQAVADGPCHPAARSSRLAPSERLQLPDNITSCCCRRKSPELNPTENIWQFIRDNWLSNRIFIRRGHRRSLLLRLEQARRQPWRIMSIGLRHWAHEF